jgi:branched-chain amino acid aminotransferase
MVNYNGELMVADEVKISPANRAFNYGDAVFETVKILNGKVVFWEEHYFRLMASMRMIRMKIPIEFTLEFLESEILKTVAEQSAQTNVRVRLTVFRKDGGFYTPKTNEIDYLIVASEITYQQKESYQIDLYKDFFVNSGYLSTIKSNNKLINTLASVYAQENDLDNCILLNERKGVVEVTNANIFILKDHVIKTPPLTEGCLKGILRGKVIEILSKKEEYQVEEVAITPFEIQKADEIFITNSIMGIQPVTKYRKKEFKTDFAKKLQSNLRVLEIAGN